MENVHIALIGTKPEPILEGYRLFGEIDKMYLLHSSVTRPVAQMIKRRINNVIEIEINLEKIDPFSMESIVEKIIQIGNLERKNNIFVNITGGTNMMAGAACSASFFIGAQAYYILNKKKVDKEHDKKDLLIKLPIPKIPFFKSLDKIQKEILHILNERGGITETASLKEKISISPQSLSYHIKTLDKHGLIEISRKSEDSRLLIIKLTSAGRLMSSWTLG